MKSARSQAEADRATDRERYERERREAMAVLSGDFLGRAEALRLMDEQITDDGRSHAQVYGRPDHRAEHPVWVPNPEWSAAWVEAAAMAARIAAGDRRLGEVAWSLAVMAREVKHNDVWVKKREVFLSLVRDRA